MALSAEQILDFQGDLGITDDQAVFTDAELDRLYERASSNYALAVYYAFRQLLAQANKYHSYTAGLAREELNQVRAHIKDSMTHWKEEARSAANQVLSVGMLVEPPYEKDYPGKGTTLANDALDKLLAG